VPVKVFIQVLADKLVHRLFDVYHFTSSNK
jgi:hypothetical protein